MQISDRVNIILSILSFLLTAISIITVVITLRQNHEMIENATRPYLTVYGAVTNFQEPQYYLVLRNFGQSNALITEFTSSIDLSICSDCSGVIPFEHIVGFTLAPNQAIQVPIDYNALISISQGITITMQYTSGQKKYSEISVINPPAHADYPISRASTSGNEMKIISFTLQDIATRML